MLKAIKKKKACLCNSLPCGAEMVLDSELVSPEWDTVTDRGTDISVGCELVKDAGVME